MRHPVPLAIRLFQTILSLQALFLIRVHAQMEPLPQYNLLNFSTTIPDFSWYPECLQKYFTRYCMKQCDPNRDFNDPVFECGSAQQLVEGEDPVLCLCADQSEFNLAVTSARSQLNLYCPEEPLESTAQKGEYILLEYCALHGYNYRKDSSTENPPSETSTIEKTTSTLTTKTTRAPSTTSPTLPTTSTDHESEIKVEPEPEPESLTTKADTDPPKSTITGESSEQEDNTTSSDSTDTTQTSSITDTTSEQIPLSSAPSFFSSPSPSPSPDDGPTSDNSRSTPGADNGGGGDDKFGTPEIIGTVVGILSLIVTTVGVYIAWKARVRRNAQRMRAAQIQNTGQGYI